MKTLIEQIKAHQLIARKKRMLRATSLLTTLVGEAEMVGKNKHNSMPTDKEVLKVIAKFIKNNKEIINNPNVAFEHKEKATFEVGMLNDYLPQQLSDDDLRQAIT